MTWSSFEKDKLLTESWRKFLHEEGQTIFGLNSKDNKDSLINILNKLAGALTPEQKIAIVNLVANAASDEDIMLEAVTLQGSKSEQDRVFSSETTREILQGIAKLGLDQQKQKAVVKALNYWGRANTVKFEKPAAASPAAPDEAPNKEPQAAPEANFDAESGAPLTEEARNALIDKLLSSNTKQEFSNIYNQLSGSKYGNPENREAWIKIFDELPNTEDTILQKLLPKIAERLSAFGLDDKRVEIRTKFIDLFSSPSEAPQTDETPAEVTSEPVYKINSNFGVKYHNTLYDSWKAKRGKKDKSTNTFNNDLKTFVDFVAPFLPSHYIKEAFKIEKMFDRGDFVSRKQEMRDAYNKKDAKVKQAISRIYTATQAKKGQKNKILFHILKNITKKSDK